MYLGVQAEPVDGMVEAKVKGIEDLGSYRIVTLDLSGQILKATLPEDKPIPEEKAWLYFPPEWTRLFAEGWLIK